MGQHSDSTGMSTGYARCLWACTNRAGLARCVVVSACASVGFDPVAEVFEWGCRAGAEFGECVFDAYGDFGVDGAGDEVLVFQAFERVGEDLGADALELAAQLAEAARALFEGSDGQGAPFVGEQVEHVAAWAHGRVHVVAGAFPGRCGVGCR